MSANSPLSPVLRGEGNALMVGLPQVTPLPCTRGRGVGREGADPPSTPPHPHPSPPRTGERGLPSRVRVPTVGLANFAQVIQHARGLLRINAANGNTGVNDYIIAWYSLGHASQANTPSQSRELDQPERHHIFWIVPFDNHSWDAQTHGVPPPTSVSGRESLLRLPTARPPDRHHSAGLTHDCTPAGQASPAPRAHEPLASDSENSRR